MSEPYDKMIYDNKDILWSFSHYNATTNQVCFISAGFANIIPRYVEVDTQHLINAFPTRNLCKLFGWQGGTIHQVVEEIKKWPKPKVS